MTWFLLASCSALLSAGAAVLQKRILFRINAFEFSFLVSLCILACSLVIPFVTDVTSISLVVLGLLVAKSVLGGTAFLFVMMSLEHNEISTALPLLGLTPAVAAILSFLVIGESLRTAEWIGLVLLILGVFLLERRPSQKITESFKKTIFSRNHWYIFGALGLFSISSVFDKMLVGTMRTDPIIVLFYQHIVYGLLFGTLLLVRRVPLRNITSKDWAQLKVIGIIAAITIAYRLTQLEATKMAPVALVLAVKRTSILYASLVGGRLFSEERLPTKILAASLIVAAGFLILRNVA
jgi:drug/metabolite transporter (DMT)-like permease